VIFAEGSICLHRSNISARPGCQTWLDAVRDRMTLMRKSGLGQLKKERA